MRVYRIENWQGVGPYAGDSPLVRGPWEFGRSGPYDLWGKHPSPRDDSGLSQWWRANEDDENFLDDHKFAFASMEQLHTWFFNDEWLRQMHEYGYSLSVYEVPKTRIHVGRAQIVYEVRAAYRMETKSLINVLQEVQK